MIETTAIIIFGSLSFVLGLIISYLLIKLKDRKLKKRMVEQEKNDPFLFNQNIQKEVIITEKDEQRRKDEKEKEIIRKLTESLIRESEDNGWVEPESGGEHKPVVSDNGTDEDKRPEPLQDRSSEEPEPPNPKDGVIDGNPRKTKRSGKSNWFTPL